jgi:hypothetical protein
MSIIFVSPVDIFVVCMYGGGGGNNYKLQSTEFFTLHQSQFDKSIVKQQIIPLTMTALRSQERKLTIKG